MIWPDSALPIRATMMLMGVAGQVRCTCQVAEHRFWTLRIDLGVLLFFVSRFTR